MTCDIVIVGAGAAGLTCARELSKQTTKKIVVLDKGRSVGGRICTRRVDDNRFDHGAQFFTAHSDYLKPQVSEWLKRGAISQWKALSHARVGYSAKGGMSALPRLLAEGIPSENLFLSTKVTKLAMERGGWKVFSENGESWSAGILIVTMPLPQISALFADFVEPEIIALRKDIDSVAYDPCVALLVKYQNSLSSQLACNESPDDTFLFIADNHTKGTSERPGCLTVHLTPKESAQLFNDSDDAIRTRIVEKLSSRFPELSNNPVECVQVHKWRYAKPKTILNNMFWRLRVSGLELALAGEAFSEARVEGAILSGYALAKSLLGQ